MIKIALVGNPNSGKTTLFNLLTGANQYVGNWPGVTVEKKEGKLKLNKNISIADLPGIYSLSPYSPEEIISRNYLLDDQVDVILNIIDGTNLERNLFLTTQLTELGIPVVVAINMLDALNKKGDVVNVEQLAKELGCHVVPISALKNLGINELVDKLILAAETTTYPQHHFSGCVEHALAHIEEALLHHLPENRQRWFAIKLFEQDAEVIKKLKVSKDKLDHIKSDIERAQNELEDDSESIITAERYKYIDKIINNILYIKNKGKLSLSDKIDKVVTSRIFGLPIFILIMFIVYYVSVTSVGALVTDWTNDGLFGESWQLFNLEVPGIPVLIENMLNAIGCADWLQSLILDGIVGGVGAVLGFVPQMIILFIFLAFLEGCGYLSRVAFIMDRLFARFGLSGKSFIPILIGTGCGVPALMASRTIENEKDRQMALITTTFIPCSAKLPIIALIAGALFSGAWWVAPSAYFIGIAAIVCSGIILKKTALYSPTISPFIMELPTYRRPTVGFIARNTWERAWSFIKKAGTIILLATIFIWFTSNFGFADGQFKMVDMADSLLAFFGNCIAWIFTPLGWGDWKSAVASMTGLIAKENVVSTFGVLLNQPEVSEDGVEIWSSLSANMSALAAFSFLVFNLLCAPCFAAMGALKRELNNKKWFFFAVFYQCFLGYVAALVIYQFGSLFSDGKFTFFTVVAFIISIVFIGLLIISRKRINMIIAKFSWLKGKKNELN